MPECRIAERNLRAMQRRAAKAPAARRIRPFHPAGGAWEPGEPPTWPRPAPEQEARNVGEHEEGGSAHLLEGTGDQRWHASAQDVAKDINGPKAPLRMFRITNFTSF